MTDFKQALEACREAGIDTGAWSKDLQYGWSSGHASETRDATDSDRYELLGRCVTWLMDKRASLGDVLDLNVHDADTPLSACAAAVRAVGRGE